MPIFVYVCTYCGEEVEYLQLSSNDKPPKRCPKCRHKMEKSISVSHWQYTRGKNKNWPIAEPVKDNKPSGKEYD